jgi:predicted Rossmann fold flavoprotein
MKGKIPVDSSAGSYEKGDLIQPGHSAAEQQFDLIVVGGGAAGFFGAIQVAQRNPALSILIVEKTSKLLTKVKVSGGGRCNVTHHCFNPFRLADHYPRGGKALKQLFKVFQASDMVEWLTGKGVGVKVEGDGRMFPATDDSQTIIDLFLKEARTCGIRIQTNTAVLAMKEADANIELTCSGGVRFYARKTLVATGGSAKPDSYQWLKNLGHQVADPVPSLFTFNDSQKEFVDLMGVAVQSAEVKIIGTKFVSRGPVLLTHWGLSGPAVIRLSAWAAVTLKESNYEFTIHVNWTHLEKEDEVRAALVTMRSERPRVKIVSNVLFGLPSRLWSRLCMLSGIEDERIWGEASNKQINRLLENIFRCPFDIRGKTTFKEEFVTCGGIDLSEVDLKTMESRKIKNVFFAGELLNIDGETGGFNFQAAWTTAYIAAASIVGETPARTLSTS